jgi:hypothetical protein
VGEQRIAQLTHDLGCQIPADPDAADLRTDVAAQLADVDVLVGLCLFGHLLSPRGH